MVVGLAYAMWVCALLLGSFVDAATLKNKVSPVQKVIELLDGLKAKAHFVFFCRTNQTREQTTPVTNHSLTTQ